MNISTILASNNFNHPSLNKYGSTKLACQNSDLNYENNTARQSEPFTSYLNFTGRINKLGVKNPNSLDSLIRSLIDFKGDNFEFAQYAFEKMKTHFGYGDLMHDNFKFVDRCDGQNFAAKFDFTTGGFKFVKSACKMLKKAEIAMTLRHEFEHFLQYDRMFRSEDIGIDKYIRAERIEISKHIKKLAYIVGEEIAPEERPHPTNPYAARYATMNMAFWNKIIESKGLLKKDSAEAKQAMTEFESLMAHKRYVDVSSLEKCSDFPKLQKTEYYDEHGIGELDNYYRSPIEIGARKAENEFLNRYVELSKKPYTPHKQIDYDKNKFDAIEEFMNASGSKYGNNNLPDRFKAYIYDGITDRYLQKHPFEDLSILDCLKEVAKQIRAWSKSEAKDKLLGFKKLIDEGLIRLNSQEETDEFMKFAENYLKS